MIRKYFTRWSKYFHCITNAKIISLRYFTQLKAVVQGLFLILRLIQIDEVIPKLPVSAAIDRIAYLFHQMIIEKQIVKNKKTHAEHLLCLEKMMDIGLGKTPAGRTSASFFDRGLVKGKPCIVQIDLPSVCIGVSMPSVSADVSGK